MKDEAKLVMTRWHGKLLSLLIQKDRMLCVRAESETELQVGEIYIGRVRNVAENIGAAFVDTGDGRLCFLPLDKLKNPILTNRSYDGRVIAGDEIVVEITREAQKTKEASGDTNLSFPGQYAVVTTGKKQLGFSGKLSRDQKQQLQNFLKEHFQDFPYGMVIRTNAGTLQDLSVLAGEIETLQRKADELIRRARTRTCFTKLRSAAPAWLHTIREMYLESYDRIITDEPDIYEQLQHYLEQEMPTLCGRLCFYKDDMLSLSALYGLEKKLKEVLGKKVWLKSGGYLIIEPTEALTVIDVNTGKYSGKKDAEETFYQMNREACEEIARQLILRNLSGIIVVDFINMEAEERRQELFSYLKGLLARDPVQCNAVDMTALGLVEITRKKVHKTLAEQFT